MTTASEEAIREIKQIGSNGEHIERLLSHLRAPAGVIPIVGSGMSVPFGLQEWMHFLVSQGKAVGIESKIRGRLKMGQYEEAVDLLIDVMGAKALDRVIWTELGEHRLKGCELPGGVKHVPVIAKGPVITINLDRVLEKAFQDAGCPFEHRVWGAGADTITRGFLHDSRFLLKMHGDVEESDGRILTLSDFAGHLGSTEVEAMDGMRPIPQLLYRIFPGRALLYLGCSLHQSRTVAMLVKIARQSDLSAQYAVIEGPEHSKKYFFRTQQMAELGILPIWYPYGRHDLMEPLLAWLAQHVPRSETAPTAFQISSYGQATAPAPPAQPASQSFEATVSGRFEPDTSRPWPPEPSQDILRPGQPWPEPSRGLEILTGSTIVSTDRVKEPGVPDMPEAATRARSSEAEKALAAGRKSLLRTLSSVEESSTGQEARLEPPTKKSRPGPGKTIGAPPSFPGAGARKKAPARQEKAGIEAPDDLALLKSEAAEVLRILMSKDATVTDSQRLLKIRDLLLAMAPRLPALWDFALMQFRIYIQQKKLLTIIAQFARRKPLMTMVIGFALLSTLIMQCSDIYHSTARPRRPAAGTGTHAPSQAPRRTEEPAKPPASIQEPPPKEVPPPTMNQSGRLGIPPEEDITKTQRNWCLDDLAVASSLD